MYDNKNGAEIYKIKHSEYLNFHPFHSDHITYHTKFLACFLLV